MAPVFGFSWKDEDAGGLNSEAWYKEWLETGDQEVLEKILRYNLDDILAMEIIDQGLREFIEPIRRSAGRSLSSSSSIAPSQL